FVASHLLPVLHEQGWQVIAALRHPFRSPPPFPLAEVSVGEIEGGTYWQKALEGVDAVVHLAARAHILQDETLDPEAEFRRVNVEGTSNLVKQAIAAGVRHFVFISSIGAMATLSSEKLTEASPCRPDTPYGRSKLQAEQALKALTEGSSMTWTILRPTLVYGAGNPGNMERLMALVRSGLPLPLAGVNNCRSFVFVGNLTDAIARCLTHPQAANQTFLLSDGQDVSTPQLIRLLADNANVPCRLVWVPSAALRWMGRGGDWLGRAIGRSVPLNTATLDRLLGSLTADSSRIRTTLDWQPPFTLEQGLATLYQLTINN
ncbi:MAG: NAD-dependent epimerase/dehydratase family protein, partial [Cyanobacteriota bacterium]|nr:NAD-dependent epimerase/dehydratase family protein [Cyanobacteriota bacterium]